MTRLVAAGLVAALLTTLLLPVSPAEATIRNDPCLAGYAECFSSCVRNEPRFGMASSFYLLLCTYNCEILYLECIFRGFQEG